MKKKILLSIILVINCQTYPKNIEILKPLPSNTSKSVRNGLDVLIEDYPNILKDKKVGLVTNHTGITKNLENNYKVFQMNPDIALKKIFAPEHGFFGEASAGAKVNYKNKNFKKAEIVSLYGKNRKPTKNMLKGLDLIIYDIQDIGSRFYTYISTLGIVIEAAAEQDIEIMILDRPNPISGQIIEGAILDTSFKSFVGYYPIPIRYGLTVGELTNMAINENWLSPLPKKVTIVKMDGWRRSMFFDETDLPWIPPSPNIPNLETAIIYPGMCLFEATNLSEGRGTYKPFLQIGAPWIKKDLINQLKTLKLEGVIINFTKFSPKTIPGKALNPKFENDTCYGSIFNITEKHKYKALETALRKISIINENYNDKFNFNSNTLNKLYGNNSLTNYLNTSSQYDNINKQDALLDLLHKEEKALKRFSKKSLKYYLYN